MARKMVAKPTVDQIRRCAELAHDTAVEHTERYEPGSNLREWYAAKAEAFTEVLMWIDGR